jgi:hypothetical protein
MRLIGVARLGGGQGQVHRGLAGVHPGDEAAEPQDPVQGLGPVPDGVQAAAAELPLAHPQLPGQLARVPVCCAQHPGRLADQGVRRASGRQPGNHGGEPAERHALGQVTGQPLGELRPDVRQIHPLIAQLAEREDAFESAGQLLFKLGLVELDPDAPGEVHGPLDYAPAPGCLARRLFDEATIDAHLDPLARAQRDDGGWTFNWMAWSPAAEQEWRGSITVEALQTLRAYGRL